MPRETESAHDDFRCACLPRRCRVDTLRGTCTSHQACGLSDRFWTTAEMDGHSSGPDATFDVRPPPFPRKPRWLRTPDGAHDRRATLEKKLEDVVTSAIRPRPAAQL